MLGVSFSDVMIRRALDKCSSDKRHRYLDLINFIIENEVSHRYVVVNMLRILATN